MRIPAWRLGAALLCGGLLPGCSQFAQLHQEHRQVEEQIRAARKELADVQKAIDDLNLKQGGTTSKMRADLTSMLGDLQTQIGRLYGEIDETQHRLNQLDQKLDRLDQRKIVVSGGGNGLMPAGTAGPDSASKASPSVKVIEGLDIDNLFNQAREDYIRGKYDLAFQGFKTVYDKDAAGSYKEVAEYWMAECLLKGDKPDRALEMYQRLVKEFPKGGKTCTSRFKIGLIHDQKKDEAKRNEAWKELVRDCPQSNEAERAREMMKP